MDPHPRQPALFSHPRVQMPRVRQPRMPRREGGPLMRDSTLVFDGLKGTGISADNVNREIRRGVHTIQYIHDRYMPATDEIKWNPSGTRLVAGEAPTYVITQPEPEPEGEAGPPRTRSEYLKRLEAAWGTTWRTGPGFRLGTRSTLFQCSVVSCMKKCNFKQEDAPINPHTRGPRDGSRTHFPWTNEYFFDEDERLQYIYNHGNVLDADQIPVVGPLIETQESFDFGESIYRLESLSGRLTFNLEFPTEFLRERLEWSTPQCPIAPFLPSQGRWFFGHAAHLPVQPFSILHLMRELIRWEVPLEMYKHELDQEYIEANPGLFEEGASMSEEDIEDRWNDYTWRAFQQKYPELSRIRSSASFALLIERTSAIDGPVADPVDPATAPLGESSATAPQHLCSRYIKVESNPHATSLADWLVAPKRVLPESMMGLPCCVLEDFWPHGRSRSSWQSTPRFYACRRASPRSRSRPSKATLGWPQTSTG